MSELGQPTGELEGSAAGNQPRTSIWPAVEERVLDLVQAHRSTIVFANSRRLAERLTSRLNELAYERATGEDGAAGHERRRAHGPGGLRRRRCPSDFQPVAAAHHGSVSREQRAIVEEALKSGRLPAVVATSSLELGIDMGAVDLVVQVEAPPTVASGLQRVGRAGHQVGAVSRGVLFPKFRGDLVQCALVAERMKAGAIESIRYLRNPLDVLAQQIVAIVSERPRTVDEVAAVVRRSAPFSALPDSALHARPRHARRPLPLRRVRRAAAPADLGPRHRHPHRPRRRAAAGGHQRRHHPRPRPVRRLPRRLGGQPADGGSASSTRRWSTSRGSATSSCSARRPGGSRTSPTTACWSAPRPASPGRCRSGTATRPGRPLELGRALGAFLREVGSATPGGRAGARPRRRARRVGRGQPAGLPRRAEGGHRPPARRPHAARRAVPRRARRLAAGRPLPVRRAGQRPVGAGARRPAARALRRRRRLDALRRRHRAAAARHHRRAARGRPRRARSGRRRARGDRRGRQLGAVRQPVPRVRRTGAAAPPPRPAPAHPAVAAAAAGGPAARRWPASSPRSRSRSRRPARCCRTSTTSPGWSS